MILRRRLYVLFSFIILLVCIAFYAYSTSRVHLTSARMMTTKPPIIVIDAGHGGQDGGAVAPDGTQEAGLNLKIAQYLDAHLQMMGVKTRLTRTDEQSLHDENAETVRAQKVSDIHKRMQIVNETDNSILVSIHQNKFSDATQWGTQVFYAPTVPESANTAQQIQQTVQRTLQPENQRTIKKCGSSVYLLYRAKRPSVLVECGFLSNPEELARLKSDGYQQQLAFSIALGLLNYLNSR